MGEILRVGPPMYCPECGMELLESNDARDWKYCEHVRFVYGVVVSDMSGWVYVTEEFAGMYWRLMRMSDEYKRHLREWDGEEPPVTLEQEAAFKATLFEMMDETSQAVPFLDDVAGKACGPNSIVFKGEMPYSAVYIGVQCER